MSDKYKIRYDGEDQVECECCGYAAPVKKFNEPSARYPRGEDVWLCEVCSSTFLSSAVTWPAACPDVTLYKSLGYIANMLLDEIRKARGKDTQE